MAENSIKAKFYKVGSIIKFNLLNMSLNFALVSLVGDDCPNGHAEKKYTKKKSSSNFTELVQD